MDVITHYSRGDSFRSITATPPEQWPTIIAGMTDDNVWGRARFADPHYLPRRVAVERELRDAFIALGGVPQVEHPFYCVAGRSPRWEDQRRPGMRAHVIALSQIPSECLSFTLGDSLICLDPDNRAEAIALGRQIMRHHGRMVRVASLSVLEEIILAENLSLNGQGVHEHLEAQLWMLPPAEAVQTFVIG